MSFQATWPWAQVMVYGSVWDEASWPGVHFENGWFLLGRIPSRNGWFRGTPISGNPHICICTYIYIYIYIYIYMVSSPVYTILISCDTCPVISEYQWVYKTICNDNCCMNYTRYRPCRTLKGIRMGATRYIPHSTLVNQFYPYLFPCEKIRFP